MSNRLESLLGQDGGEPEGAQDDHPDASWRADALGRSRHSRLTDHIQQPFDDHDPERAAAICADASRELLLDFAPALILLPDEERRRCQALATYAQTLFDFASQPGVEGERLSALNRIEFTLDQSLGGDPPGQPAFVRMAIEETRQSWDLQGLDEILKSARMRVVAPRLETPEEAGEAHRALARALVRTLGLDVADPALVELAVAALRIHSLLRLGEDIRRDRSWLPVAWLPRKGDVKRPLDREGVDAAVEAEIEAIRQSLAAARTARNGAPAAYRSPVRYLELAALALTERVERLGWQVVSAPPGLGVGQRLWLLLRSRF